VPTTPGALAGAASLLTTDFPRLFGRLFPFLLAYAALLMLERAAIAKMDWWMEVDTMTVATRTSLFVSALATWLRLCVIGAAVWRALGLFAADGAVPVSRRFLVLWGVVSALLAAAVLVADLWLNSLRFAEGEIGGEAVRTMWLGVIYAQLIAFWLAARLYFGAGVFGRGGTLGAAWGAVGFWRSIALFVVLVGLKLAIETVLVSLISYLPVVAPFWFIPNELAESRFFVGQGAQIAAESLGVMAYVAFFVAVDRDVAARRGG
jgi:hypothetical protein